MREAEELAAIAAYNEQAYGPTRWGLRWLYQRAVPTGTVFQTIFQLPAAAALYRLEYLIVYWPLVGAFRPLYLQMEDDSREKFFFVDYRNPHTSFGASFALFTTPGTNMNQAVTGNQALPLGALPLNLDFPGKTQLTLTIRGATGAPNPSFIDFLLAGHQKNELVER